MSTLDIDPAAVRRGLVDFIGGFITEAGFTRGVVGISGGLDSSVTVFLSAAALGPDNVLGLILPYKTTNPACVEDATTVAEQLGIRTETIDITPQIDAYFDRFADASPLRRGNKMARERMAIIYDHAKAWEALVVGTGNKTEYLLGYTTLWGDMGCDLRPLGGLYKTQVRQLAHHLGVPEQIIHKPPTAGLWPGQTDEGEMGITYKEADQILYRLIDKQLPPEQIAEQGFDRALVDKIDKMVRASAHKRCMPPTAQISDLV